MHESLAHRLPASMNCSKAPLWVCSCRQWILSKTKSIRQCGDALGVFPALHLPNFFSPPSAKGLRTASPASCRCISVDRRVLSRDTAKCQRRRCSRRRPADGGHDLVLERALLQPARLELSWLGRGQRILAGTWVGCPDSLLQKALISSRSTVRRWGRSKAYSRHRVKKTIQSRVTFQMAAKAGYDARPGNIADEVLRQFVPLHRVQCGRGTGISRTDDFVLASTVDRPTGEDPPLGVGRPLAVVRAQLSLELFGPFRMGAV